MYPKSNPVANFVRSLLRERGLRQMDLAEALGIDRSAISQWTNGMTLPADTALIKMAEMAEVEADYLLRLKQVVELQKKGHDLQLVPHVRHTPDEEQLLTLFRAGDYAAAITMLASRLKRSAA